MTPRYSYHATRAWIFTTLYNSYFSKSSRADIIKAPPLGYIVYMV